MLTTSLASNPSGGNIADSCQKDTAIILLLHVFQTIVHPQFLMSLLEMMDNGILVFWVVGFSNLFQWIFQSISIS
jgi:hypothetical protein